MLPFIRADLAQLTAYTPHPGGEMQTTGALDHLDTNENPYDLPADLKEKLAWTYQQAIAANRYPDGGHEPLKQAIAAYVSESAPGAGAALSSQHISIGNGSDELIRALLIATCLQGSGAILVAQPTFSMYAILAQTLGVPVVSVNRHPINFAVDLEAAQQAIATATCPVRVVFMVHPNSPTANALTPAELNWLQNLPESVLVVVDEAYFEFSQQTTLALALQRSNWVILRTFSKAFRLAAHRVGYAIAQPRLTQILEKVRLPYNLPSFSQAAALTALRHRQSLLTVIPDLLAERDRLLQALTAMADLQVWPSQANFIYVRPQPQSSATLDQLFTQLKAQGTLIRQTGGGLRITVGTPAENQRTLDHLARSLKAIVSA
ncbi:histidinol-phosphate transaminase [Almyronema epifaneia]|uniref:Histidinol-phosphate aminotransferase n=1 Tax=Almyronema epifaneia S1 TaxID=2991925 RepID=A0ABW6IJ54_9CYAN